jgi:DNA-binding CsgD family transcriptional regulator
MPDAAPTRAGVADVPAPAGTDDSWAFRRSLRDLAALLALPAMWSGHDPAYIAEGLLGVLFSLLRLDSAYVRFDDPAGGPADEGWRPHGPRLHVELERALTVAPSRDRASVTLALPVASGDETVRITRMYPTLPGEDGLVLVGSLRLDFPTDRELFLLRVAVGQAAIAIHAARLLAGERAARAAAEAALRSRNQFLAALAEDLTLPLTTLSERAAQALAFSTDPQLPQASSPAAAGQSPHAESGIGAGSAQTAVHANGSISAGAVMPTAALPARLTRREAEVLGLLAQGLSNKEIAAELWLSDRTVERHITGLYRKIGAQRRTEATAFAVRHGLGDADAQEP